MNTPQLNAAPYLITSRSFPTNAVEMQPLLTKMYFEVANAVNSRTIGIFDQFQIATGNRYLNTGDPTNRLQSFRQVYIAPSILNGTTTIATGISIDANTKFVQIYGTAQNTSFAIPLPYVNTTTPADSITLRVNLSTGNIEIITTTANWTSYNATVVLEYILNN